jgi:thioredoxin-dependent peroxiredoxin
MLCIGDKLPLTTVETTRGELDLRRYQGAGWLVLFGYPADFTAVCSTELAAAASRVPAFAERTTRLLAVGTSDVDTHRRWARDVEECHGSRVQLPIVADPDRVLSEKLGLTQPADPARPARVTYVVEPGQTVAAVVAYPSAVGRDWDELLRLCDGLRLRRIHGLSAPAGWRRGDPALIPSALSDHEADHRYRGWWSTPDGRRLVDVPRRGGELVP